MEPVRIVFIFKTSGYNVKCDELCPRSNRSLPDPNEAATFNDNELKELERFSNVKLSLTSVETLVLFF